MANERKVVLSVEDNQDIANLIRLVLRHAPIDLLQATTGDEATLMLARRRPDLILLDMMLPGKTGLDYLTELRKDARFADTPVVVISVRADTAYRARALELGVVRYLLKPFSPAVLRHEIQQILGVTWQDAEKLPGLPPSNV